MYKIKSGYVLGFHGCDEEVALKIVNQKNSDLRLSKNKYDWLGFGIYFWENNSERALAWAVEESKKSDSKIKIPAVLGAVISLGNCLDLLDTNNLETVKNAYEDFCAVIKQAGLKMPENKYQSKTNLTSKNDRLIRNLDCAVIENVHKHSGKDLFDSVRGMFVEGDELYPDSGFRIKDHIQIAVRNTNCIKGYFLPKSLNIKHKNV